MLPPRVPSAFQPITHLGAPVRVFSPWRGALPLLIIPVLWPALLALFWKLARESPGGWPPWLWGMWGMLGVWLLVAAILGGVGLRRLREWAVVYEGGFARTTAEGVKAWRWEDVQQVFVVRTGDYYCHRILTGDGDEIRLTSSPDYLGKTIRDQTFPLRRQRLAEAFGNGDTLDFGRFTINRAEGRWYGDRALPWGEIRSMRVSGAMLTVSMKSDTFFQVGGGSCLLSPVPDPDVLLHLAKEMGVEADPEAVRALP